MQMLMSGEGNLTPQELIICAIHSQNLQHKLQCIDEKDEKIEFPVKWRESAAGYYGFRYKN